MIRQVKTDKPLELAVRLFHEWNGAGVKYCHWKGNNHLLEGLRGKTDLDILMSESSKEDGIKVLLDLCFIHVDSQYGSRYPFVEDWVGCDEKTGVMLHVHLHYRIVSGHHGLKEYTLPFDEELLSSRINSNEWGIYTANPSLELLMLYTRIGIKVDYRQILKAHLNKYHVSNHDMPEIVYLKDNYNREELALLAEKYYGAEKSKILEMIDRETYDSKWIIDLHKLVVRKFKKYGRYRWGLPLLRLYYRFTISLRNYLSKHVFKYIITKKTLPKGKGVMAVFVGQDGAGKSTVTGDVIKWLRWKVETKRFYFGSGDGFRSWRKSAADKLKGKGGPLLFLRLLLTVSNYRKIAKKHLKLAKKMRGYVLKGGVAICDRFPQMQYAGINDGPNIRVLKNRTKNKWVQKYLDYHANREEKDIIRTIDIAPDVLFKLMLPVEESARRKPDENVEAILRKHEIIESVCFREKKCIIVDATQEYGQEVVSIKNNLWSIMFTNATSETGKVVVNEKAY